ncbi:MAG: sugar ABC transporter permease, partial [Cyanobacteria bacterium REEB65]|nr:sugar ABC transporter permease [Cyanobacteria bacterium REEB65]
MRTQAPLSLVRAKPRHGSLRDREAHWAWVFLLPAVLGIAFFGLLPTVGSLAISFTSWDLLGAPRWVGLANYTGLLADPLFYQVAWNTVVFVGCYVVLDLALALGIAMALHSKLPALGILRTAYFLPVVTSMIAISILWEWIYDPRYGALDTMLGWLGIGPIYWLSDRHWAMAAIVLVSVWKNLGYDMVLFLAGLQAIPREYSDAAAVDGASGWTRLWRITLPLLAPTVLLVAILATIRAFQTFDAVYM